jgi:hypothetical protein
MEWLTTRPQVALLWLVDTAMIHDGHRNGIVELAVTGTGRV